MADFLTVDDLVHLRVPLDAQHHPLSDLVAFTVTSATGERDNRLGDSSVWIAAPGVPSRRVTAEGTFARHPRWSPDGKRLAIAGHRRAERHDQVLLLDEGWSEAVQLGAFENGVRSFAWSPAGDALAVLATDPVAEEVKERREQGRDWIEYEENLRFNRLWTLDPATGEKQRFTAVDIQVYEFAWSPAGDRLAALVADQPFISSWYDARLAIIDAETGEVVDLYHTERQLARPSWSPDGRHIAVVTSTLSDEGMTGGDILLIDPASGDVRNLTPGHPRSYLSAVWDPDSRGMLCPTVDGGHAALYYLPLDGEPVLLWREFAAIQSYAGSALTRSSDGGRIAMIWSTPDAPLDVWQGRITEGQVDWQQLTEINPEVSGRGAGVFEEVFWESTDGCRIQGLLYRPRNASGGGPPPMVTIVHGGPTSLVSPGFPEVRSLGWAHLLAARGIASFLPNFRGSMGFGVEFAEANLSDLGGGDLQDVLTGIDYCVEKGVADPDRLGICGWSYGGYLTPWAITQTGRFKAAVSGASITNWTSFHGRSTIQGFDEVFNRADPYNVDGFYTFRSPVYSVDAARTPTLFIHGERDLICPAEQSHEMWRALRDRGVETQLVIYPREEHGFREREHVRDLLERLVGWFADRL